MSVINSVFRTCAVALLWAAIGAYAQPTAVQGEDMEVRGVVQLWAPGALRIEVDGRSYRLARDVQVLDREARPMLSQVVRPGLPVLLLVTDGEYVTHVVINPGSGSPLDGARR